LSVIISSAYSPYFRKNLLAFFFEKIRFSQTNEIFGATVFLISVPVFFQAPLVRTFPWLSLAMTGLWLWISLKMLAKPLTRVWGDLLFGFTWTWLTGSIYWGWLRAEPLLHLPVEAIGVPFAIWCLYRNWGQIGNWFYLGSLFGTAITDGYFYITDLIPYWRKLMVVEPEMAISIFQSAAARVLTSWGISWIVVLVGVLLIVGIFPLRSKELHWWAFGGAVLSTILVDGLFFLAACAA